jgi:Ca-activated chloride channel family protein
MLPRTVISSVLQLAVAGTVAMMTAGVRAEELSLSSKREFWTADQLYEDFLADFGGDPKSCYISYTLKEGPPPPDGPKTMGSRWKKAIIAIDASGSMTARVGGERKMDAARAAVRRFLDTVPPGAEVGLLAFGHRGNNNESGKAESCAGVELLSGLASVDTKRISSVLDDVQATGWTPLAAAITKAGESFTTASGEGEQGVFVVSDGLETCGGDPVTAARALHESDVKATVNIIGFNIPEKDRKRLEAVAHAGGGAFSHAANRKELEESLRVRYANLEEKLKYETAALQVRNDNNTSALRASNRANTCVLDITNNESTRFLEMSNRMVRDGQTDSESARGAYQRLRQRHDELKAALQAFSDRAKAEMKAINDRIDQERERVKSAYDQK